MRRGNPTDDSLPLRPGLSDRFQMLIRKGRFQTLPDRARTSLDTIQIRCRACQKVPIYWEASVRPRESDALCHCYRRTKRTTLGPNNRGRRHKRIVCWSMPDRHIPILLQSEGGIRCLQESFRPTILEV